MLSTPRRSGQRRRDARLQALAERYHEDPQEKLALRIIHGLDRGGRPGEAFKWAKHARERFPQSRRAEKVYNRLKKRKTTVSLRRARRRAKAAPSAESQVRLCELLRISGKLKKAFRVARAVDSSWPDHWHVQLALGKLWFDVFTRSRDEDDGWTAVEHLDRSRCLQPDNYSTLLLLGISLLRLGSLEDALVVVDEALQTAPDDPRVTSLRNRVLHELNASAGRAESSPDDETTADAGQAELLGRLLELPGSAGAFAFASDGRLIGRAVRDSQAFDFSAPPAVMESMAAACRLDTQRIGLGELVSCSLAGDGWSLDYHAGGPVLVFFEGESTGEQVEAAVGQVLASAPPQPAQPAG